MKHANVPQAVLQQSLTGRHLRAGVVFQVDTGNLFSAFQDSSGLLWQADFNFLGEMAALCARVSAALFRERDPLLVTSAIREDSGMPGRQ